MVMARKLALSAYECERCNNPVVAGSLEDSKGNIEYIGAICLHCYHQQEKPKEIGTMRIFDALDWD